MKKGAKLLILLLLGVFVAFIACSDNSTDSDLTEGDPDDPNFLMAQGLVEGFVDSTFNSMMFASEYLYFEGNGPLQATSDSMHIIFDSETCWWEIYISYDDTTGFGFTFIDSVKFQDVAGCQQFPDSTTTTQIEYRAYADVFASADSGSIDAALSESMLMTGIQSDLVVINASGSADIGMDYGQISYIIAYDGTVIDITFYRDDLMGDGEAYPISGSMALAMNVDTTTPNGSASISWTMDITFYEDHYHVRAESGDNYWEWDVYYAGPA